MESSPESTITQTFNPFVPTGAPWGMGATGLIYEPLIQFNLAAPPKYYPWLATSYKWSDGGKTLTFAIRQGARATGSQPAPRRVRFSPHPDGRNSMPPHAQDQMPSSGARIAGRGSCAAHRGRRPGPAARGDRNTGRPGARPWPSVESPTVHTDRHNCAYRPS